MSTSVLHLAPGSGCMSGSRAPIVFRFRGERAYKTIKSTLFLPASSRIFSGLLLGLIGLCFIAAAGEVVTWQAGSAYSDTFLYNGFAYKTIRIFNTNDTRLSISMAAAPGSRPSPSTACLR